MIRSYTGCFFHPSETAAPDAMSKPDFIDYICRPYCMFFKEGEKEDMACLGARVAQALAEKACFSPEEAAAWARDESAWRDANRDALLFENVCRPCEFRAEDCEYRSEDPLADALPCGGLILLALLLARGVIHPADMERCL